MNSSVINGNYNIVIQDVRNSNIKIEIHERAFSKREHSYFQLFKKLQENYHSYLAEQLKDSDYDFRLQLTCDYKTIGTSTDYRKQFFIDKYSSGKTEQFDKLFDSYFNEIERILIIGEEGAGKTTLLFQFAINLLEISIYQLINKKGSEPFNFYIPIIINLATWDSAEFNYNNWLTKNLYNSLKNLGVVKSVAKEIIENKKFILLFDGLDEISTLNERLTFLNDFQSFIEKNPNKFIINCKRQEYIELGDDKIPISAVIDINDFEKQTINEYLTTEKTTDYNEKNRLRKKLELKPMLYSIVNSSFFLFIALALEKKDRFDVSLINSKNDLVKLYINQQISNENDVHYLSFVAYLLQKNNKNIFEIVDFQPELLNNLTKYFYVFNFIIALSISIASYNLFALFFSASLGIKISIFSFLGIFSFLMYQIISTKKLLDEYENEFEKQKTSRELLMWHYIFKKDIISYNNERNKLIKHYENLKLLKDVFRIKINENLLRFSNLSIQEYFEKFSAGFIVTFSWFCFLIGTLLMFLNYSSLSTHWYRIITESILWSSLFGGIGGIIALIASAFKQQKTIVLKHPYNRLISEFFVLFTVLLIPFIVISLIANFSTLLYFILPVSVIAFLMSGLFKYTLLQFLLMFENKTPFLLSRFLNKISKTGIMFKIGGNWRFRNKIIRDYFVNTDNDKTS